MRDFYDNYYDSDPMAKSADGDDLNSMPAGWLLWMALALLVGAAMVIGSLWFLQHLTT